MAVALNSGETVNNCDTVADFDGGSQNTDLFVEGTGSVGQKTSQATIDWTATVGNLGATQPYDYDTTGGEFGQHIVLWLNVLGTPSATDGGRITVKDSVGVDSGVWYVPFPTGYTGGFQSRVINTAQDFNEITGAFTLAGNPAQLTNVDEMGGGCNVTSKINGNFINAMIDHFTTGTGLRADAGTTGVPNTFEIVRAADEGGTIWGWLTSFAGSFIFKGGLYLGPATGTATSVFTDTGQVVIFAAEQVAVGFYDINARGTGTDIDLNNCVITAEDPAIARWSITIDPTSIPAFNTDGGLFAGYDVITMQASTKFSGTTLDDGNSIVQNDGTIDNCVIQNSNTADGVALIQADNITNIKDCAFTFSDGHAIEITDSTGSPFTFSGNTFSGAFDSTTGSNLDSTSGSTDAMIYNNSGAAITINLSGGDPISVRNGANATTTVVSSVNVTVDGLIDNTEVRIYETGTTTVVDGIEDAIDGTTDERSFTFSDEPADVVDIVVNHIDYLYIKIVGFTIPATNTSIPIQQVFDRNYANP